MSTLSVSIKNITGFLSPQQAFTISDFSVNKGEQIALLGKSGSGKSTLLNLLSGMIAAKKGSISVNQQELTDKSESQRDRVRREHIGMIFQTYQLLPEFTVLENVQMGALFSPKKDYSQASEFLKKVGLEGFGKRFPNKLSVGQQQRVAIARALIKSPPLILADEPTGALDHDTGSSICDLLQALAKEFGSTLIFVTHDQQLAQRFSKQVQVSDILQWTSKEGGAS